MIFLRIKIITIFVFLLVLTKVYSAEISLRKNNSLFCYDGDTCYIYIDNRKEKIRLLELDTPEISKPKCEKEYLRGIEARDFINQLIEDANSIIIETDYSKDYFGRTLAYLIVDGVDVSNLIIEQGMGVKYQKGEKNDWCKID